MDKTFLDNYTNLLPKINQSIPAAVRKRFAELNEKLQEETITTEEHQELLALIDQIELADAERIQNLSILAKLRLKPTSQAGLRV